MFWLKSNTLPLRRVVSLRRKARIGRWRHSTWRDHVGDRRRQKRERTGPCDDTVEAVGRQTDRQTEKVCFSCEALAWHSVPEWRQARPRQGRRPLASHKAQMTGTHCPRRKPGQSASPPSQTCRSTSSTTHSLRTPYSVHWPYLTLLPCLVRCPARTAPLRPALYDIAAVVGRWIARQPVHSG